MVIVLEVIMNDPGFCKDIQRNDISTFEWTCPTVLFQKQLNSILKLKAVNFKYYQYPVNWSCFCN